MSPKKAGGDSPSSHEHREDLHAYQRASRFASEATAGSAYQQAQDAVFAAPTSDLSVYRLILGEVPHLAVLGRTPSPELAQHLTTILASGEPAKLPPEVWRTLSARRRLAMRHGPWVEGHYRPGRRPRREQWP